MHDYYLCMNANVSYVPTRTTSSCLILLPEHKTPLSVCVHVCVNVRTVIFCMLVLLVL